MINTLYGFKLPAYDVSELGKKVLRMKNSLMIKAGLSKEQDHLPDYFKSQPVVLHNVVFDESDADLDQVINW